MKSVNIGNHLLSLLSGGYDKEEKAARAYDLAALKYWGTTTTTNFPVSCHFLIFFCHFSFFFLFMFTKLRMLLLLLFAHTALDKVGIGINETSYGIMVLFSWCPCRMKKVSSFDGMCLFLGETVICLIMQTMYVCVHDHLM